MTSPKARELVEHLTTLRGPDQYHRYEQAIQDAVDELVEAAVRVLPDLDELARHRGYPDQATDVLRTALAPWIKGKGKENAS